MHTPMSAEAIVAFESPAAAKKEEEKKIMAFCKPAAIQEGHHIHVQERESAIGNEAFRKKRTTPASCCKQKMLTQRARRPGQPNKRSVQELCCSSDGCSSCGCCLASGSMGPFSRPPCCCCSCCAGCCSDWVGCGCGSRRRKGEEAKSNAGKQLNQKALRQPSGV